MVYLQFIVLGLHKLFYSRRIDWQFRGTASKGTKWYWIIFVRHVEKSLKWGMDVMRLSKQCREWYAYRVSKTTSITHKHVIYLLIMPQTENGTNFDKGDQHPSKKGPVHFHLTTVIPWICNFYSNPTPQKIIDLTSSLWASYQGTVSLAIEKLLVKWAPDT